MKECDVLISGAGVSGLFTALGIRKELTVTILEKQNFPPFKLCGGLLCREAHSYLAEYNPPHRIFHSPRVMNMQLSDLDNGIHIPLFEKMHNLNRDQFYTWLAGMLGANVNIRSNCKLIDFEKTERGLIVKTLDKQNVIREFKTGILIGADGFFSPVRRHFLPDKPGFLHSIQFTIASPSPDKKIRFIFSRAVSPSYYIWSIPRDENLILGTAMEGSSYHDLLPLVEKEWGIRGKILSRKGHPITRVRNLSEISPGGGKILLTGEAAGLVRPSSGEGLSLALRSAMLAAEAINREPRNPFPRYEQEFRQFRSLMLHEIHVSLQMRDPEKRRKSWKQSDS